MIDDAVARFGRDAVHSRAVDVDAALCRTAAGDVAYVDVDRAWIAVGSPLAADRRAVSAAFVDVAHAAGRRAVFFGVEGVVDGGAGVVVGAVPEWRTASWPAARSVRAQLRRAQHRGVTVRRVGVVDDALGVAIDALVAGWQRGHTLPPFAFLARTAPRARDRWLFVAERGGALVALASASHLAGARRVVVDDLVRAAAAPQGTSELLIDAVVAAARAVDVDVVTLGVTPLVGARGPLAWVRALCRPLYDFDGLYAFRARLHPDAWVPVSIAASTTFAAWRGIVDALRAFAGGSFVRFAARTLVWWLRR